MVRKMTGYSNTVNEEEVLNADPHRLIQIIIESALEKLGKSAVCIKAGDLENKAKFLTDAISFIGALKSALDFEKGGEIATNLDALYDYSIMRCTEANRDNNPEYLEEVMAILLEIKTGWDGIREEAVNFLKENQANGR